MHEYHLRRVGRQDERLLYHWVSDSEVRKNSFHTGEITWQEHERWFHEHFVSEQCDMFILEYEGNPVGQVRIDWQGDRGEIDYSIGRNFRGLGYGTKMLQMVEKKTNKGRWLYAEVKKQNKASNHIFEQLGYKKKQEDNIYVYEKRIEQNERKDN